MVDRDADDARPELTVVIVDDDPLFCRLLTTQLQRRGHHTVVAEAGSVEEGGTAVETHAPDVVLVDLTLGSEWGGELIQKLAVSAPTTMVAVLTGHPAEHHEATTTAAGAFVFYEKALVQELPDLLSADHALFRRALAGEDVLAPSATARRPTPA